MAAVDGAEQLGAGEELHRRPCHDDGCDAELHEAAAVGCEDGARPVQGVVGRVAADAVERDQVGAHQEDGHGHARAEDALAERRRRPAHAPRRRYQRGQRPEQVQRATGIPGHRRALNLNPQNPTPARGTIRSDRNVYSCCNLQEHFSMP